MIKTTHSQSQVSLDVTLSDDTSKKSIERAKALSSLRQYGEITKEYSWSQTVSMTCTPDDAKRLINDSYDRKLKYIVDVFVDSHNVTTC